MSQLPSGFAEVDSSPIIPWDGSQETCIQGLVVRRDNRDPDKPLWILQLGQELRSVDANRVDLTMYLGTVVRIEGGNHVYTVNQV